MNKIFKPVRSIIKYNTSRKYFGNWSPKQLHNLYQDCCKSEENISYDLETGIISVNDICDTLWTEMSYNPLRFGDKSPFVFNNSNSIKDFCANYKFTILDNSANTTLAKIKSELKQFLTLTKKYDPSFEQTGVISTTCTKIKLDEYSFHPNIEYKILAHLVACIHVVCRQNLHDYYKSVKHRFAINQTCLKRHPDFERKIKNPCFSKIESLTAIKDALLKQISYKNSEILNTQMCIEDLSEYENPVDTSREQEILKQHNIDLQCLDSRLQQVYKELDTLTR